MFIPHTCCSSPRQLLYNTPIEALNFSISVCINPPLLGIPISKVRTIPTFTVNFLFNEYILASYLALYLVYTDGSMSKTTAGYAFCIPSLNIKTANNVPLSASTFTTEFGTILEALYMIRSLNPRNYLIVSNSQASILSFVSSSFVLSISYLILQIHAILFSLSKFGFIIEFLWVPNHVGNVVAEYFLILFFEYSFFQFNLCHNGLRMLFLRSKIKKNLFTSFYHFFISFHLPPSLISSS